MLHSTVLKYKENPAVSFTVKLVKQSAKAHSEKTSFQQPFYLRNKIGIFYVFRQIIPEKRS